MIFYDDQGCTQKSTDLNDESVSKQMTAGLNQEIAPFVEKCAYMENYKLSHKLTCQEGQTTTVYYSDRECTK